MNRPNYQLEQNPQYTGEIPQLLNDDPVLAESGAFHDLIVKSLNNTKASYQKAEKAQKTAGDRASIVLSREEAVPAKGDNTYTFQVTELSDVAGEIDSEKLEHARKIGELESSLNGWKIYNSLEELGFTNGQEILEEVCAAMPNRSILYCQKTEDFLTEEYPYRFGLLKIERLNAIRCHLEFMSYNGSQPVRWTAWYASNVNEPHIRGWRYVGAQSGTWTPSLTDGSGNANAVYSIQRGKWVKTDNTVHVEIQLTVTDPGSLTGALHIPLPIELYKDNTTICYPQSPLRMSNVVLPQHAFATIIDLPAQDRLRPTYYIINTTTRRIGISSLTGEQIAEGIAGAESVIVHGSIDYMGIK